MGSLTGAKFCTIVVMFRLQMHLDLIWASFGSVLARVVRLRWTCVCSEAARLTRVNTKPNVVHIKLWLWATFRQNCVAGEGDAAGWRCDGELICGFVEPRLILISSLLP